MTSNITNNNPNTLTASPNIIIKHNLKHNQNHDDEPQHPQQSQEEQQQSEILGQQLTTNNNNNNNNMNNYHANKVRRNAAEYKISRTSERIITTAKTNKRINKQMTTAMNQSKNQ